MASNAQTRSFMPPGGMNDSVVEPNLDPDKNEAPLIRNGEFDLKGALRKRRGSLRIYALEEVDNPFLAPTLKAT